jgi:hypothetical protein
MLKLAGIAILSISGALVTSAALADHGDNFGANNFGGNNFSSNSWGGNNPGGNSWGGNGGPDQGGFHMTAPEIDPSSAMSALTLLAGGLTVLRSRYSKK